MSHLAILTIEGQQRPLLTYFTNYFRRSPQKTRFNKSSNGAISNPDPSFTLACDLRNGYQPPIYGRPYAQPYGGLLYLTMEATDNDELFYYWLKLGEMRNGTIDFYRTQEDDDIPFYRIEFWDAFLVQLAEHTGQNDMPMILEVDLSPAILRYNKEITFRKLWHVTDIDKKAIDATPQEEEEKEITEVFWKDAEGEGEIDELPIDNVVTLYATTKGYNKGDEIIITITSPKGEEIEINAYVDDNGIAEVKNFDLNKYM